MKSSHTFVFAKPVIPAVREVTLTMTFKEAKALRIVLGEIGGFGPLREVTEDTYRALLEVPGMPPVGSHLAPFTEYMGHGFRPFPVLRKDFEL